MECRFEKKQEEKGVVGRLSLRGEIGIADVAVLKGALQEGLEASDLLVVDCSGLDAMDSSGMQLLCSAHRSAATTGKCLIAKNLTEGKLETVLGEAGFVRHKACPKVPQGEPCLWSPSVSNQR